MVSPSSAPWWGLNSVTVSARTRVGEQLAQRLAACRQRWRDAAIRVLGQRRVEKVDEVDVEVDGQAVTGGKRSERGSRAAAPDRTRPSARRPPAATLGDHLGLEVRLRPEPEEADLLRRSASAA